VLSSKEQMEIIKGALAQDYRGPIYKLLEQAAAKKAEQMQGQQPQQPQQRETGGLVQSYESAPPSMINLPTGQKMGRAETLEDAGRYKTGGIKKYETGGDLSEEEMDLAYEDYTMRRQMEDEGGDHDSAISYNQFAKQANTYGTEQAMGYYSNEQGKTVQPFSNWQSSSAKKAVSQNQIQSWSQEQKTQYYNEIYGGNKMISPTEMMQMDQTAWDKANPPKPSALDVINSEATNTEAEEQNLLNLNLQRGQQGGDIVREATDKAAPYVLGGLGLAAAAPFAIGGLAAGTGGGLIGAGSRQAVKPILKYGNTAVQGFKNAFQAGDNISKLYRTRQLLSGTYNATKALAVPQVYSAIGGQGLTELRGEGNYKNRLSTAGKVTDLVPALSGIKDATKITSDLASGDYTSAGLRTATAFVPGFKKNKQFKTGIRHHTTKLVNKFLDTKPTDEDAGIIGDVDNLVTKNVATGTNSFTDLGPSDEEEKVVMNKGGFKKRKKLQYGGPNPEASSSTGLPIGAGVAGSRNDVQQAYSRGPEIGEILGNLDWGDAAKTYLNESFNPTKWFDGKSALKAAYNELVPLNARLLIEDVAEEQLYNKDSVYGKYSPLAYLPESGKKFLGYKNEVTEKDLSKGELEALRSVVENRKRSNRIGYYDYPGEGVGATSMLEKMTDNNTVLETTIGQGNVKETDHDYTVKDTFDFNYVKWKENAYKEGKIDDNLYNYIRWQFAPKYGSVDDAGMPININIPKIGDGTKTTKTGAKQFDEGPKFAKKGGVRKYKTGGDGGVRHFDAGGLYHNINHKKKSGTSRSKANSTVSKKAYSNMKSGFKKKYETGGDIKEYEVPEDLKGEIRTGADNTLNVNPRVYRALNDVNRIINPNPKNPRTNTMSYTSRELIPHEWTTDFAKRIANKKGETRSVSEIYNQLLDDRKDDKSTSSIKKRAINTALTSVDKLNDEDFQGLNTEIQNIAKGFEGVESIPKAMLQFAKSDLSGIKAYREKMGLSREDVLKLIQPSDTATIWEKGKIAAIKKGLKLKKWKKGGFEKKFKPHMMYSKAGKGVKANTMKKHLELKKKEWGHTKPKKKK
tara:strand:+ start:3369 stop:6605 length:3237 start_codon:yes stop_codon:yes gene_type:complete